MYKHVYLLGLSKKGPLLEASPISDNLFLENARIFSGNAHISVKMRSFL